MFTNLYIPSQDWWWVIDNRALLSLLSRLDPIPTPEGEDCNYSDEEACVGVKRFPLSNSSSSSDWGPPIPTSQAGPAPLGFATNRCDLAESGANSSADVSPSHLDEVDQLASHFPTQRLASHLSSKIVFTTLTFPCREIRDIEPVISAMTFEFGSFRPWLF